MKKDEIENIIIVASKHETKFDFLEKKRNEFGCWPKEYAIALIGSFERLYTYLNEIDPYHYLLTKKDGSISELELDPDDSCFDSNRDFLYSEGEVSMPFKKYIELYIETNGEFKGKFTLEELTKIKPEIDAYCFWLKERYLSDDEHFDNKSRKPIEIPENRTLKINPIFNPEKIEQIFSFLNSFFSEEDRVQLKDVLETGKTPDAKLFFRGNGKTLLDFFKQLIRGQFLTIAVQKDFEIWVSKGFEYLHRGNRKSITQKYASKIISGNDRAAKGNRITNMIKVSNKFELVQLEIKNRVQNKNT